MTMSRITGVIPPQNNELVRDRIGEVLIDELENQALISYTPEIDATVFVEYGPAFHPTQMPCVNVKLGSGSFDNKDMTQVDGSYVYYIDCHAKALSTDEDDGSTLATYRLHRIMGIVRAILENPQYKTLGFAAPSISSLGVQSIDIQEALKQDSSSTVMGRLTFNVKVVETVELITPRLIDGYNTQVKLGQTDRGYIFSGNNIPAPEVFDEDLTLELMDIYQWD